MNYQEIIDNISTELASKSLSIIKGLFHRKLKSFDKKSLHTLSNTIEQAAYIKLGELIAKSLEDTQALKNTRK